MNAQVLGISIDHIPCIQAWAESLGGINFPLLSDFWPHGAIAKKYGVFREEGHSERAIFVVDKDGIVKYIDIHDIDDQPSNDLLRKILKQIDPENTGAHQDRLADEPIPEGNILLYCTPWCPDCHKARRWLDERRLDYIEIDITKNANAAKKVMSLAKGNRTTPTFDIDGYVIVDWDADELEKALVAKGLL